MYLVWRATEVDPYPDQSERRDRDAGEIASKVQSRAVDGSRDGRETFVALLGSLTRRASSRDNFNSSRDRDHPCIEIVVWKRVFLHGSLKVRWAEDASGSTGKLEI
ncbi:uncharacterized protein CIMG_13276 [Coccidioides immitis RS]|uniref:Uncharacterized protein n=1 Tax=Coccidioides immitis (strain RS) TaxID=246410 RepID=A0A0D8JX44_COCIM|nr:uncharacterized protein CIMG_13276 [Coccidioides immitis RS]KJF60848.1 hypothetical protein CIMG_13276 [Coccidioides immitis RS]